MLGRLEQCILPQFESLSACLVVDFSSFSFLSFEVLDAPSSVHSDLSLVCCSAAQLWMFDKYLCLLPSFRCSGIVSKAYALLPDHSARKSAGVAHQKRNMAHFVPRRASWV
jgi:hypothetical protein